MVSGDEPAAPRFFESGAERLYSGGRRGGNEALRPTKLDRAESYKKQVKNSLGWAHYQEVRKDVSIRRYWQLVVCCAFTFCWWACAALFVEGNTLPTGVVLDTEETSPLSAAPEAERGKKEGQTPVSYVLARGVEEGEGVAGAVRNAMAILESVLRQAPAQRATAAA